MALVELLAPIADENLPTVLVLAEDASYPTGSLVTPKPSRFCWKEPKGVAKLLAFSPWQYGKPRMGAETKDAFSVSKLAAISLVTSSSRRFVSLFVLPMASVQG